VYQPCVMASSGEAGRNVIVVPRQTGDGTVILQNLCQISLRYTFERTSTHAWPETGGRLSLHLRTSTRRLFKRGRLFWHKRRSRTPEPEIEVDATRRTQNIARIHHQEDFRYVRQASRIRKSGRLFRKDLKYGQESQCLKNDLPGCLCLIL